MRWKSLIFACQPTFLLVLSRSWGKVFRCLKVKIGSQCFLLCCLFGWFFGMFCCCFLPGNEQETPPAICKTAICPIVPINSSSTSVDLDATVSTKPWLYVQACGAIPNPSWVFGCRYPRWSQVLLLCQRLNASWSACLVSGDSEHPFGTSTERNISHLIAIFAQENLTLHKGQPWCFCHFFPSKCLFSIYQRYVIQINSKHSNLLTKY